MRVARRTLPRKPQTLLELATLFENGNLNRFSCCASPFFKGCVQYAAGSSSIIFACTNLLNLVINYVVTEIHADATFKVVPRNMGYQRLTLHYMIQNHVSLIFLF